MTSCLTFSSLGQSLTFMSISPRNCSRIACSNLACYMHGDAAFVFLVMRAVSGGD